MVGGDDASEGAAGGYQESFERQGKLVEEVVAAVGEGY